MNLILFGSGSFASLAWYWLNHDSDYTVVGFTVDAAYISEPFHYGLPVVSFETVEQRFPPIDHRILLPIGPQQNNMLRANRCAAAAAKGYALAHYLSSRAIVPPGFVVRENTMIFEGAVIQPFANIGRDVNIRSGSLIGHHATIGDDCFIAAGACVGGNTVIGARCFLGLNSTVVNDIEIAAGSIVAAGAVMRQDAKRAGTYAGVPAKLIKAS